MSRTVAIVLTVFTVLCCGLPGLGLICIGALAGVGAQMPEVAATQPYSPGQMGFGIGLYVCVGLILLLIPILVGVISFRVSRPAETAPSTWD